MAIISLLSCFSSVSFDSDRNCYAARIPDFDLDFYLELDHCEDRDTFMREAIDFCRQIADWRERATSLAVSKLLPLKNDVWIDEDNLPLSADEFRDSIRLTSIHLYHDGLITCYFDDGDLFWGHVIVVSGNTAGGPQEAEIAG